MILPRNYRFFCFLVPIFLLFVLENHSDGVAADKVLFLLPIASKSHKHVFEPLIKELALRGHDVLVISPIKSSQMPDKVEEFVPVPVDDIIGKISNIFENRKSGQMLFSLEFINKACHRIFQHPEMQSILKRSFDLIIVDALGNNCMYGVLSHFAAPTIFLVTLPAPNYMSERLGLHFPPSFIPNPYLDFSDQMSFSERMSNTVFQWIVPAIVRFKYVSEWESIYRQYLGSHMPSSREIESNTSMLMMNSHFSVNYPRPLLPDVIEVGGMHCRPSKPLPDSLQKFLDQGSFIFFSLGSIIKENDMPENYRKMFLKVFSKLKQRVLWKWETDKMDNLPPNVKLITWAPQQDILGHPNIDVFMTHGGLLSTQEAVYHGVPLLGIPMFGDQDLNMHQAERAGFAVKLEILELTEELLENKLYELINNAQYKHRAKELSALFKDQPQTPLERAAYWSEYIMKHKGAPHLRSAARDLHWIQYHSLDVFAVLFIFILGFVWGITLFYSKLIRPCFYSNKPISSKVKKTQ